MNHKIESDLEFKIDKRSKQDVVEDMRTLAESYTPEWKFDSDNPDAGSVIGLIFANQTAENIRKLNRMIEKYHIEFANMYGVSLSAAKPAEAIVTLSISENVAAGVGLKKGMQVIGENEDGEEIIFTFMHDLYATRAKLTTMLAISGAKQKSTPLYGAFQTISLPDGEKYPLLRNLGEAPHHVSLFSYDGENLNTQAILMYHQHLFAKQEDTIGLRCTGKEGSEKLADILTNTAEFLFCYPTENGLQPFEEVRKNKDIILLKRVNEEYKQKVNGSRTSLIVLKKIGNAQEQVTIDGIDIIHNQSEETLDFFWNHKTELDSQSCCPFGQQPVLYDECYLGQEYLTAQTGALITLSFDLSFASFSITQTAKYEPDLAIVKRKPKQQYKPLHYECWVQETAIEYFNGKGWRKLPCAHDMSTLFSKEENTGRQEISFQVPADWQATTQGGYEGKCIRIQVTRADNCYLQDVVYHYPVIRDLKMKLQHQKSVHPEIVKRIAGNQIADITSKLKNAEPVVAFSKSIYQGDYVFLGFDTKFEQGPIAFFVEMEERLYFQGLSLSYTYSSEKGFKPLKVIDQTNQFEHSGMLMFMPPADFAKMEIDGVSGYWIRIEDTTQYFAGENIKFPVIQHFYMNAVNVENIQTKEEQDYYIDAAAADMHFSLYSDNVLSLEVWVNEREELSVWEMEEMLRNQPKQVKAEYNFLGEVEDFFVLWHEVESFDIAHEKERCYVVDRLKNEVIFGDGVRTKIPKNTRSVACKIKVICCDGNKGNVEAHTINKFRGAAFSINHITNPIDAFGGNPVEDTKTALYRGSNLLGARKRLVSEQDYIKETKLFSETIAQAACVTGVTKSGQHNNNVISLVLLMKDYQNGSYSFKLVEEALKNHLQDCCEMTCRKQDLEIVEPIFVKVSLHIWLTVPNMKKSIEIKQHWIKQITQYLEPVTSQNNAQLGIGKLPKEKQIRLLLNTLEEEATISHYTICAAYTDAKGTHEVSLDQTMDNPFMVCCNGTHQIHIIER